MPKLLQELRRNLGSFAGVQILPYAIFDQAGSLPMYLSSGASDASSSLLKPLEHYRAHPDVYFNETLSVEAKTGEQIFQEAALSHVDLIWMDLQGAELQALRSFGLRLQDVSVIYTETNYEETYRGNAQFFELRDFLSSKGFELEIEFRRGEAMQGNALFVNRQRGSAL